MKYILLLFFLVACSTIPNKVKGYWVNTDSKVYYYCAEYHKTPYGSSAKNCMSLGGNSIEDRYNHVDYIPNPTSVVEDK